MSREQRQVGSRIGIHRYDLVVQYHHLLLLLLQLLPCQDLNNHRHQHRINLSGSRGLHTCCRFEQRDKGQSKKDKRDDLSEPEEILVLVGLEYLPCLTSQSPDVVDGITIADYGRHLRNEQENGLDPMFCYDKEIRQHLEDADHNREERSAERHPERTGVAIQAGLARRRTIETGEADSSGSHQGFRKLGETARGVHCVPQRLESQYHQGQEQCNSDQTSDDPTLLPAAGSVFPGEEGNETGDTGGRGRYDDGENPAHDLVVVGAHQARLVPESAIHGETCKDLCVTQAQF